MPINRTAIGNVSCFIAAAPLKRLLDGGVQIPGLWAGDIATAKLPDRFLVDYVRVYDLVDAD